MHVSQFASLDESIQASRRYLSDYSLPF